jgi:glycosyltransferase involved in cell wall biosynthesis
VSIILPTYNGAKFVNRSIDSCLHQTYQNIELVIVDDCSKDKTPEIIKSYQDIRIKYFRHEKNLGLPTALNTGFSKATGEYLTWTSDDNYYSEKAIEKEMNFIDEKKCQFVYCDYYRFRDEHPSEMHAIRLPEHLQLQNNNDVGPCVLYSKAVAEAIGGYDPETELAEDYDYWLRVSKKFSMCHIAEPLYFYREHPNSLSLSRFYEVRGAEILVKSKNGVHYDNTLNNLADLGTRTHSKYFGLRKIYRTLLVRRIKRKLLDFENGRLTFKEARIALKDIIDHNSQASGM